jgi:hypothetical protein
MVVERYLRVEEVEVEMVGEARGGTVEESMLPEVVWEGKVVEEDMERSRAEAYARSEGRRGLRGFEEEGAGGRAGSGAEEGAEEEEEGGGVWVRLGNSPRVGVSASGIGERSAGERVSSLSRSSSSSSSSSAKTSAPGRSTFPAAVGVGGRLSSSALPRSSTLCPFSHTSRSTSAKSNSDSGDMSEDAAGEGA